MDPSCHTGPNILRKNFKPTSKVVITKKNSHNYHTQWAGISEAASLAGCVYSPMQRTWVWQQRKRAALRWCKHEQWRTEMFPFGFASKWRIHHKSSWSKQKKSLSFILGFFPPLLTSFLLLEIFLHNAMDCSDTRIRQNFYRTEFDHKTCVFLRSLFLTFSY